MDGVTGRNEEHRPAVIPAAQITRRADADNVPAQTVERDYVLAHAVAAISASAERNILVFKGGTALRLCHFAEYRYSADLDFSVVEATRENALEVIEKSLQSTDVSQELQLALTDHVPPRLSYVGPLGRRRTLKLDIADDELVVNTEHRPLLPRWPDLPDVPKIHVYTPLEIASEKLRCVIQRCQCRDFFDLDMLFSEFDVEPREAELLFREKAQHRGIDPESFSSRFEARIDAYRRRWEIEIAEHVSGSIPHFEELERSVRRHLRRAKLV